MTVAGRRYIVLDDTAATEGLGANIARVLRAPAVIWLEGDLGAGKTTLSRGLLHGLGHAGNVKSPTYTLVEPYTLPAFTLFHLDLYRLADPEELEFLGVRELAADGSVLLVEWPARGAGFLPPPDLAITLAVTGTGRCADLEARSARGATLLNDLELPA